MSSLKILAFRLLLSQNKDFYVLIIFKFYFTEWTGLVFWGKRIQKQIIVQFLFMVN